MILKYLLVIGVIALIYFLFIKKKPLTKQKKDKKDNSKITSEMIECSKCHIFCEIDDAILSGTNYYCSKECLKG